MLPRVVRVGRDSVVKKVTGKEPTAFENLTKEKKAVRASSGDTTQYRNT